MNAVICPDAQRLRYEAQEMAIRSGGKLHPGGRLEHQSGNVTLFMTYAMAQLRLRGLRLEDVRFVDPWRVPDRNLVQAVRDIAAICRRAT